ncbi:MAG TPA: guanylate kinase [Nakamurella sp.]|nr:guanylate kinase [Nakamurella sp.]
MAATGSWSDSSGSRQADPVPRGRLFVLSGPSGVGKSTVLSRVRSLIPGLWYSVSVTTRARRPGEVDGVNYHFVSHRQFAELVAQGQLLEHAHFAGNHYGTPRAAVEQRLAAGQDVLLEIEVQGARQVRAAPGLGPEAVLIFLAPPSFDELARRLVGRGTEDEATREARLLAARAELDAEQEFDHTVVNTDVQSAAAGLVQLMAGSRPGSPVG